jgi:hypothetical protein
MTLKPFQKARLQSFKHDKSLHRIWDQVTILEENEDYIVVANRKTKVIEAGGRVWYTKEPSVSFFFKNYWYNVIGIIKTTGISFYCNLSSPVLYDLEAIKYIDYDLDIMVLPDFSYSVLDQNEYQKHQKQMNYPEALCAILEQELKALIIRIENREFPFQPSLVQEYYQKLTKTGAKKNVERP